MGIFSRSNNSGSSGGEQASWTPQGDPGSNSSANTSSGGADTRGTDHTGLESRHGMTDNQIMDMLDGK